MNCFKNCTQEEKVFFTNILSTWLYSISIKKTQRIQQYLILSTNDCLVCSFIKSCDFFSCSMQDGLDQYQCNVANQQQSCSRKKERGKKCDRAAIEWQLDVMISGFSIQHFCGNLTKKLRIIFSFDIILCFHLAMVLVKAPTSLKCEIYPIGRKNVHHTIANGLHLQLSLSDNADSFTHAAQQKDLSIKNLFASALFASPSCTIRG